MKKPAIPPFKGASSNSSFFDQGLPFAPADSLNNVIPYDSNKDRPRLGTRPGSREYFRGTWGNGARVQGCGIVARGRTATGYALGTGTDLLGTDGDDHTQAAIAGNVWKLDAKWGLSAYDYENVTATGPYSDTGVNTQPNRSVNAITLSPDGTKIVIGESYMDGSANRVARVTCRNATTLAVIWSKKMTDTGINRFVSAIACSADWCFVCTNHFIRVFAMLDGANPSTYGPTANVYGMNGWSSVAKDVKISADGNTLYCLFLGTSLGTTLTNGSPPCTVTAGIYAQHFRSGIMKFTIASAARLVAGLSTQVLTQSTFSTQISTASRYYEGNGTNHHNYLRFSEQMPWAPRGLSPVAMTLRADGSIVVAHSNAAWGPDGNSNHDIGHGYIADDYLAPDGSAGYYNLTAFSASGVYMWRQDGNSIKSEDGGAGFFNDLLSPTALAITSDSDGNVYTAGRRTLASADGVTNFGWNSFGDFLWKQDLGATIRTLSVMPGSMDVVAGGDRNNDWLGASGANAQLWQLRAIDGAIGRALTDIGNVSVLGTITQDGDLVGFVSDKV